MSLDLKPVFRVATQCVGTALLYFVLLSLCQAKSVQSSHKYLAIVPSSNDLPVSTSTSNVTEPVPPDVGVLISNTLHTVYEKFKAIDKTENVPISKNDFTVTTYRFKTPIHAALYVFKIEGPYGWIQDYFAMQSNNGRYVTKRPPSIYMGWFYMFAVGGDDLLDRPYLRFSKITSNGRLMLIVETYAHNGNLYNASEYHYLQIGSNLSLTQVLVLEHKDEVPIDVAGYKIPRLERDITQAKAGHLHVIVKLFDLDNHTKHETVGTFDLARTSANLPYHLISKKIKDKTFMDVLVSASDEAPNDYLANGGAYPY
jgi:hypothetical protein